MRMISTYLLAVYCFIVVRGMAPIRDPRMETVHQYRRRMGVDFKYKPKNMHPEQCRFLSEAECRRRDEESELHNPTIGDDVNVLVLLVRFNDHQDRELPTREYIDTMMNGARGEGINVVGSVKDYLRYASMKQYNVNFHVQDWVTVSNNEEYYSAIPYGSDSYAYGIGCNHHAASDGIFSEALNVIDEVNYTNFWDFDKYGDDGDFDTYLDHLVVIHSGYDATYGSNFFGDCPSTPEKRIWGQGCSRANADYRAKDSMTQIGGWSMVGAFSDCSGNFLTHGLITHEFMHGFGLLDLYETDGDTFPADSYGFPAGTGFFDLMSYANGWNNDGKYPSSMGPYSRLKAGWLNPTPITVDGVYAIQTSQVSSNIYIISQGFPDGEYLLIENRQPVIWDQESPTGGILFWRVNENELDQNDRYNYRVTLEQADGKFSIEEGNLSDAGDFWTRGMTYSPGGSRPNTDSFVTGNPTGISVTVLSESQLIMAIRVEGLQGYGGFAPVSRPKPEEDVGYDSSVKDHPLADGEPSRDKTEQGTEESMVGSTMAWIFSMLGGIAVLTGVAVALL